MGGACRYLHALIEALRISFSDGRWFIADPQVEAVPTKGMLDKV
jgi:gamma-glutamyltranspeptidase/glutathione hydrolase